MTCVSCTIDSITSIYSIYRIKYEGTKGRTSEAWKILNSFIHSLVLIHYESRHTYPIQNPRGWKNLNMLRNTTISTSIFFCSDIPHPQVTHISRVGGSLNIRKEGIRAGVFKPTVAPPTMTVEEFGEIELERARQRQARHFPAILPSTLFYTDDHTVLYCTVHQALILSLFHTGVHSLGVFRFCFLTPAYDPNYPN